MLETVITSNPPAPRPRRLTLRTSVSRARSTSESSRSSSMSPRPSLTGLSDLQEDSQHHGRGYELTSRDYFLGGAERKHAEGEQAHEGDERVRTPLVEPLRLAEEEKPRWREGVKIILKPGL